MGNKLYLWLLLNYAVFVGYHVFQGEWPKALYWAAALQITVAVKLMK